jgi:hypothetical protein
MDLARHVSANGGWDFKSVAEAGDSRLSFAFGIPGSVKPNLNHFAIRRKS